LTAEWVQASQVAPFRAVDQFNRMFSLNNHRLRDRIGRRVLKALPARLQRRLCTEMYSFLDSQLIVLSGASVSFNLRQLASVFFKQEEADKIRGFVYIYIFNGEYDEQRT